MRIQGGFSKTNVENIYDKINIYENVRWLIYSFLAFPVSFTLKVI